MKYFMFLNEIGASDSTIVGGKAANLARYYKNNWLVSPAVVIPTTVTKLLPKLLADNDFLQELKAVASQLKASYFSVRSSAVGEDGITASFAGQFSTELQIPTNGLVSAINVCWQNINSVHMQGYRQYQQATQTTEIAIIIQAMVFAKKSGVIFTVNPVTQNTDELVIEVIYGVGELLAQGKISPRRYVYHKKRGEITLDQVGWQDCQLIAAPGNSGLLRQELMNKEIDDVLITTAQLKQLIALSSEIEVNEGCPQDIEWAMDLKGQIFLVQARPITTLSKMELD